MVGLYGEYLMLIKFRTLKVIDQGDLIKSNHP